LETDAKRTNAEVDMATTKMKATDDKGYPSSNYMLFTGGRNKPTAPSTATPVVLEGHVGPASANPNPLTGSVEVAAGSKPKKSMEKDGEEEKKEEGEKDEEEAPPWAKGLTKSIRKMLKKMKNVKICQKNQTAKTTNVRIWSTQRSLCAEREKKANIAKICQKSPIVKRKTARTWSIQKNQIWKMVSQWVPLLTVMRANGKNVQPNSKKWTSMAKLNAKMLSVMLCVWTDLLLMVL